MIRKKTVLKRCTSCKNTERERSSWCVLSTTAIVNGVQQFHDLCVEQQNTSWYSPTRNREFNFSGRYRSRERVRVPNKRHVRLGRSQSAPCPAPQRRHERNQEKGKLRGIKRKNLVRRGEHVALRVWKREARRRETRTRRFCAPQCSGGERGL